MTLNRQKSPRLYLALCFAAPCVSMLLLMLVAGYTPFGNKSMLYSDMWHQYYPFFVEFRNALRSGDSLLYNWTSGMGLDYLGLISYYLASPLNLVSVLLPETWLQGYFGLLVPIKLGFAGLFFGIFLQRTFKKNDLFLPLFAWFYGMCAWALGYQWNVMWLDTFALMPLVTLGTIALLRDRKVILYTVSLFFSIFCNYYIGFFTCIFVFLVFVCYQICCCKKAGRFFLDLARIAVFSILAIGMSAILELPALAALQNTQSSVNTFPEGFAMNIVSSSVCADAKAAWAAYMTAKDAIVDPWHAAIAAAGENGMLSRIGAAFQSFPDVVKQAMDAGLPGLWWTAICESFVPIMDGMCQVAGNMSGGLTPTFKEGLPNLYCGIGTIIFCFIYLTIPKIRLREKLCCVSLLLFFMLSFLLRQLDYIWHGFHFTNMIPYRFSFLSSFVMLYMAYRTFLLRRELQLWQIVPAAMLTLCVFLCSKDYNNTTFIMYNGAFLLLYMAIFILDKIEFRLPDTKDRAALRQYFVNRRNRRQWVKVLFACVMCAELVANLVNFGVKFPYTGISNYPKGTTNTSSMVDYIHEDDDLFFRTEVTHSQTLNDSALNGYYGISTFTSSANVRVTQFMRDLGYAAKNTYNRYCFEESSPVSNLFLNLKYMIERDGRVEENPYFKEVIHFGSVYLLENDVYLPLGFLAESSLADLEFIYTNGAAFSFQNKLFTAATGIDAHVWNTKGHSLTIEPNGTVLTSQNSNGYTYYKNEQAQTTMHYRYEFTESGFFCLDINMSARNNFSVWRNNKQLYSESVSLPQTLAVSQVEPGDIVEIHITCDAHETGSITIRGGLLNDRVFRRGYEILSASTLQLTDFSNTRVAGTINCDRDGLLYTSIPQNGTNWSAYVDGEPAEIRLVGEAMIALDLTEGPHEIVFAYRNEAFELGCKITAICLLLFCALVIFIYRPWTLLNKKGKYSR